MRVAVLASLSVLWTLSALGASPKERATRLLAESGVKGGLIVHLGCGDGRLTAALRASEGYLVQGLDTDPANVAKARRHIQSLGLYGPVSVDTFDGERLPYADNLVNLLVVESPGKVSRGEMMRVLAPLGVALVRRDGQWVKTAKPWPSEIDEWTHFLHDASNNAVAHDRRVAAPRGLQWAGGPLWCRSHEYDSSLCAMVSARGRLFYIFDEGPTGIVAPDIPDRWTLVARDAFSGVILWKRPIADWGWRAWRPQMKQMNWRRMRSYRCASPLSIPRRLVAAGDRVFVTLGYRAPVTALDAATGQTLLTFAGTDHADEILYRDGRLVVCVRPPGDRARVMAFDAASGRKLWESQPMPIAPLTLAVGERGIFLCSGNAVVGLDGASGQARWRTALPGAGAPLVVYRNVVLCKGKSHLVGLSADEGKILWRLPAPRGFSVANPPELFVADGLVWYGHGRGEPNTLTGYDPTTGRPARTVRLGPVLTRGHHFRCYRSKATDDYLILGKRGVEFLAIRGGSHSRHNWVRGACRYGVLPCNGLLYSTPHPCFCYAGVKLGGFLALSPQPVRLPRAAKPRLVRGPAYSPNGPAEPTRAGEGDWPMHRHDPRRSGATRATVQWPVGVAWATRLGGRLTQPVVVGGRVFVAQVDAGRLWCLDAATGKPLWDYTAGGRIDSAPSFHRGLILFGSADGWVYCLRASDGALAWRFQAAPEDRRIVAFGRVESAWPVHGSILILDGVAYFAAGRSSFLDGGLFLYGVDPLSGKAVCRARLDGPHTDPKTLDQAPYAMDGAKSDILVSDGNLIYLFFNAYDKRLRKQPTPVLGKPGIRNLGERKFTQHLFTNSGFLDHSWFNRNHWVLGDVWTGFNFANQAPKAGQLVVFDDQRAYAVKCFVRRNMLSPLFFPATDGYFLVADKVGTRPAIVNARRRDPYIRWLPQDGKLMKCWNLDVGFARGTPPEWVSNVPVRIRAMVRTGNALFALGPPDVCDPDDPTAALEGRRGAVLLTFDAASGRKLDERKLDAAPVFDGLVAARGRLYMAAVDGRAICLAPGK